MEKSAVELLSQFIAETRGDQLGVTVPEAELLSAFATWFDEQQAIDEAIEEQDTEKIIDFDEPELYDLAALIREHGGARFYIESGAWQMESNAGQFIAEHTDFPSLPSLNGRGILLALALRAGVFVIFA